MEPGESYFAVARLPTGRELVGYVEAEGDTALVTLEPEAGDASPQESLEQTHYLTAPRETASSAPDPPLESLGPAAPAPGSGAVTLRHLVGNPFTGELHVAEEETVLAGRGGDDAEHPRGARSCSSSSRASRRSRSRRPRRRARRRRSAGFVTRPVTGRSTCILPTRREPARPLPRSGFVRQAAETLESPNLDAENLLRGKMADPIAAAVGAYALLSFADLERLHDWTQNLYDHFPDLADAAAIRVSIWRGTASMLRHSRCSPWRTAACRRSWTGSVIARQAAALRRVRQVPHAAKRCDDVLEVLKRLAPLVDFGKPVLTFAGDPIELLRPSGGPS